MKGKAGLASRNMGTWLIAGSLAILGVLFMVVGLLLIKIKNSLKVNRSTERYVLTEVNGDWSMY